MENEKKEEVDIKQIYGEDCLLEVEKFKKKYKVKDNGLSSNEALNKIKEVGQNQVKQSKPKRWYNYFFSSLFSPINSILLRNKFYTCLYRYYIARKSKPCKYYSYSCINNNKYTS